MDLGGDVMQGDINVSQLVEQSKIGGSFDEATGETITESGPARFSPR